MLRVGPGALSRAHFTQRARRLRFVVVATADPAALTSTHTMSASTSFATVSGVRHMASSKSVRGVAIRAPARVTAPTSRGATLRVNAEGTSPIPPLDFSTARRAARPRPRTFSPAPLGISPSHPRRVRLSWQTWPVAVPRSFAAATATRARDAPPTPTRPPSRDPRIPFERRGGPSSLPRPLPSLPPRGLDAPLSPSAPCGEAMCFPRARVPPSLTLSIPRPDSNSVREEPRGDA